MVSLIRSFVRWLARRAEGTVILAVAVVSSGQCVAAAQNIADQHACCAAMQGECEAVGASCCSNATSDTLAVIATKPTVKLIPGPPVVALVGIPPTTKSWAHNVSPPERFSPGRPGVPTYLFVSSFRI